MKDLDTEALKGFFKEHIANKKHRFLVVGNKKEIDMKVLSKLRKVKVLELNEVFNY